jgi:sulfhydrogenase subunit gamma (sulfur reductase)
MSENIYQPRLMTIAEETEEAPDIKTLRLQFKKQDEKKRFYDNYRVGQFGEFSVFGEGECPFCVASPPYQTEFIECTFRKAGKVTRSLWDLNVGDTIGMRGPYGNGFPIKEWVGKNLLFLVGGIALPAVRATIWNCLSMRKQYKNITIIYGAQTEKDMVYKKELGEWENLKDIQLIKTVDPGGETPGWKGEIGFVPHILYKIEPEPENTITVVCGPPVMIKFSFFEVNASKFKPENVYTTLENRMKCGLGKCGRCNVGNLYVCKDGPVFTMAQLEKIPETY